MVRLRRCRCPPSASSTMLTGNQDRSRPTTPLRHVSALGHRQDLDDLCVLLEARGNTGSRRGRLDPRKIPAGNRTPRITVRTVAFDLTDRKTGHVARQGGHPGLNR